MAADTLITKEKKPSVVKTTLKNAEHLFFSSTKRLIISVIIIALIAFAGWKVFGQGSSKPQYQTASVTQGTIIQSVTESGNVTTNSQGGIGSPTTGIIEELYVKNGDTVTQGQNLFKVKSTATAQEIASAYASYLSAQNNVNSAQAKLNSLQATLFQTNQAFINDKGIPNPSDQDKTDPKYIEENDAWMQAQADYVNQQGVISQAQASFTAASLSYQATQDSIVTAPISGTIANTSVQPGDEVTASSGNLSSELSSSSNTSSGSTVLSIGNFSQPYIKVQASEVDIPNIKAGEKATITLNAYTGKTFVGKVTQVDTVGTVSSGVVTYNVYVSLIAAPSSIEPGMSATVTIQTARKDNVLTVPSAAIQTTGGTPTVRVLQNGQIESVAVTTGISSDTDTEIDSGLTEGQTVVTGITQATTTTSGSSPFGSTNRGFGGGFGGGAGGGAVFRTSGGGAGGGARTTRGG